MNSTSHLFHIPRSIAEGHLFQLPGLAWLGLFAAMVAMIMGIISSTGASRRGRPIHATAETVRSQTMHGMHR